MEILLGVFIVLYFTWRFMLHQDEALSVTVKQWVRFIVVALMAVFVAAIIVLIGSLLIEGMENRNLFSFLALCIIVLATWIAVWILMKFTPVVIQKILGFYYDSSHQK